jgi:hypothetical protein
MLIIAARRYKSDGWSQQVDRSDKEADNCARTGEHN